MAAGGAGDTVERLIEGIRAGTVPRQVRLFAAQGLLPVAREELYRLQALLAADPDPELAEAARRSLREEPLEGLVAWVESGQADPVELDLLVRVRDDEALWAAVARAPGVSDETLRRLARHGTPLVQDIVVTNQVRLLGCLEILEDLRANPQVTQDILRRVREFEEEFIEKAATAVAEGEELEPPQEGPSIEGALAELEAMGANIPEDGRLEVPPPADRELAEEAERRGQSAYARLLTMTTHEKILAALKGSREERGILINSRNRLVVRAVLASPKLTESEVERYAASRSVSDEVIRIIAANPRWLRRYGVISALAGNPKTPVRIAMHLLPRLNVRDLKRLSRDRNIHPAVRKHAEKVLAQRR